MNINHILFPTDFSDNAQALTPEVEWLSAHFDARVTLMHVFEIPTSWYGGGEYPMIAADDLIAYAEIDRTRLENYCIQVPEARLQRVSAQGDAAWHIADWVRENAVDLIMMGTHGYGAFRRMLLGSVAMKVIHDVHCPVWTHALHPADGRWTGRIANIVCAIGASDEAISLLQFTAELAHQFQAKVHLIHTVPQTTAKPYRYFDIPLDEYLINAAKQDMIELQTRAGTDYPVSVTGGFIAQETANLAQQCRADLIIVGRGKAQSCLGGFRTHICEIMRQVPCPVLTCPTDWQQRQAAMEQEMIADSMAAR